MFDFVVSLVERTGYFGIALLMFAENVFPPIPSELIMPLGGFVAAKGELNIVGVVVAGSIGSLLGAIFWYYIGRLVGADRLKRWASRHGRWLGLSPHEVDAARDWFQRHGWAAVFFGRMLPGIRTLISVPAGMARMSLLPFLLYSAAGTIIFTVLLTGAGYLLKSNFELIGEYMNPISNVVVIGLVLGYIYRVVTFDRRNAAKAD
ncbi:DedA family protein [Allohahella marinimesophila]|uniref:DedA family protein n=1 Tax=Allohahella marinimesophila TaxID=1054972 RepID=A0ABP7PK22_9GAMM